MTVSNSNKVVLDSNTLDTHKNSSDYITIDLDESYGTTTSYYSDGEVCDITLNDIGKNFTVDIDSDIIISDDCVFDLDNTVITTHEVERMCEYYPSLNTAWKNFKSIYDMTKQDWEGKKKSGDVDNDTLF